MHSGRRATQRYVQDSYLFVAVFIILRSFINSEFPTPPHHTPPHPTPEIENHSFIGPVLLQEESISKSQTETNAIDVIQ